MLSTKTLRSLLWTLKQRCKQMAASMMTAGMRRYLSQQQQQPQEVESIGVLGSNPNKTPVEAQEPTFSNLTEDTKDFLKDVEGFETTLYVPLDKTGATLESSGPTIASGFDLGQRNLSDLKSYNLPKELEDKLKPYLGKKGEAAKDIVEKKPLTLTDEEASLVNAKVKQKEADKVEAKFNANSQFNFKSLPDPVKTMITSVAFQYGIEGVETKVPNWWSQVTSGDWSGAYANLKDFGDKYKTRRGKEAKLIEDYK